MVHHERAQDDVEGGVGKWECFDASSLELNGQTRLRGLLPGAFDHFRCRIDANHDARIAHPAFGGDRKATGPTADVEYRLARRNTRKSGEALADFTLPTEC